MFNSNSFPTCTYILYVIKNWLSWTSWIHFSIRHTCNTLRNYVPCWNLRFCEWVTPSLPPTWLRLARCQAAQGIKKKTSFKSWYFNEVEAYDWVKINGNPGRFWTYLCFTIIAMCCDQRPKFNPYSFPFYCVKVSHISQCWPESACWWEFTAW